MLGKISEECFNKNKIKSKIEKASLDFFTQSPASIMQRNNHIVDQNAVYVEWYYNKEEKIRPINGFAEKVGYQIKIGS